VRSDEERSDSKSGIPHFHITNNLVLVVSLLASPITPTPFAIRFAHRSLGPAIIKGGQALASRPDLLPKVYLEELQKLQDDVPRFDDDVAFEIVNSELGVPFDELFELIGDGPVAAASIGQVYKARLKATGDIVAVKIQRPNCEDTIALDLYILRWWSGIANVITQGILKRDVNVISIIDDFGELIYREIDYVAEAANAQRFNEIYASLIDTVAVPKVISALTTSKVLVMEWVDGIRLTDASALQSNNLDREGEGERQAQRSELQKVTDC